MSYCFPAPKPLLCSPGYFLSDEKCHICPAGKYSKSVNASSCSDCPRNETSGSGAAACLPCEDGFISRAGMSYCYHPTPPLVCSPGFFLVKLDGVYECSRCPDDTWSAEGAKRIASCFNCPEGAFYAPGHGCIPCPEGSKGVIDSSTNKATCQMCDPGQTTLVLGSKVCVNCPAGMFSSGSGKCQYCWPATYADEPGSRWCKSCPAGLSAPQAGAAFCSACGG